VITDKRLETHIPYIGNRRVPCECFGEFELHQRCKHCFNYPQGHFMRVACRDNRLDLIDWNLIVVRVYKDLRKDSGDN